MLSGMRHTAVLVLGCLLVALVMACGGGPSEAEIEATVVARIDEKQAEDGLVIQDTSEVYVVSHLHVSMLTQAVQSAMMRT